MSNTDMFNDIREVVDTVTCADLLLMSDAIGKIRSILDRPAAAPAEQGCTCAKGYLKCDSCRAKYYDLDAAAPAEQHPFAELHALVMEPPSAALAEPREAKPQCSECGFYVCGCAGVAPHSLGGTFLGDRPAAAPAPVRVGDRVTGESVLTPGEYITGEYLGHAKHGDEEAVRADNGIRTVVKSSSLRPAAAPAEPREDEDKPTTPETDPVGTVRRFKRHLYVKLTRPAVEPWHIAYSEGPQRYSGWQDNESMEGAPVVGYVPIQECYAPADPADPVVHRTSLHERSVVSGVEFWWACSCDPKWSSEAYLTTDVARLDMQDHRAEPDVYPLENYDAAPTLGRTKTEADDQPMPIVRTDQPFIHDLVADDLRHSGRRDIATDILARGELGKRRYGTRLQPHNGRDALRDAYEEALDGIVYTRQAMYETVPGHAHYLSHAYTLLMDSAGRLRQAIDWRDNPSKLPKLPGGTR